MIGTESERKEQSVRTDADPPENHDAKRSCVVELTGRTSVSAGCTDDNGVVFRLEQLREMANAADASTVRNGETEARKVALLWINDRPPTPCRVWLVLLV